MVKDIKVSGVGCCLVDYLFNNISFTSETFSKYLSKKRGDGGLIPGQLVFAEEFSQFTRQDFESTIKMVKELNQRKSYPIVVKGDKDKTILVENVRAISGLETDLIKKLLKLE